MAQQPSSGQTVGGLNPSTGKLPLGPLRPSAPSAPSALHTADARFLTVAIYRSVLNECCRYSVTSNPSETLRRNMMCLYLEKQRIKPKLNHNKDRGPRKKVPVLYLFLLCLALQIKQRDTSAC